MSGVDLSRRGKASCGVPLTTERTLPWEGSVNTRWVLPGLIRSANLAFLTPPGRAQLLSTGPGRIIDLRNREERRLHPVPFVGAPSYLNLPLLPYRNRTLNTASQAANTNGEHYRAILDHSANQIVTIFGAIHDAPPGPILLHCHLGKDRTGLVVALALELAGTARAEIAADYAQTDQQVGDLYAALLARQADPQKRARLETFLVSREQDILSALEHLDTTWGGAAAYLEAFGLSRADQQRLTTRLMAPPT